MLPQVRGGYCSKSERAVVHRRCSICERVHYLVICIILEHSTSLIVEPLNSSRCASRSAEQGELWI